MLIAIAGGIGVGKSLVTELLREKGKNVIICDDINRELLNDKRYIKLISKHFPEVVKDEKIDKAALRNIIFTSEEKRMLLNSLAHPLIMKRVKEKAKKFDGDSFVEIPLLIESGMAKMFDGIWLIAASMEKRVERIMKRDNIDEAFAIKIINSQAKEQHTVCLADRIIDNSGTEEDLKRQIFKLLDTEEPV